MAKQNKTNRFTFRASPEDRELIAILAAHLQRTQSDAVRFVVVEAARKIAEQKQDGQK